MYTFAFLLYTVYFLLYTVYFCCILKKMVNISMVHHFYVSGALKRRAPQILSLAHVEQCATVITSIRGVHRRAPRIKVICGFICVAHARCATDRGSPSSECLYMTWTRTLTTNILGPNLMGLRGTQVMGSISYTLVSRLGLDLSRPGQIRPVTFFC
jgi:hypothetical protein